MAKSLLYRLFGIGRMPPQIKSELSSEGLIVFDEAVKSSITYRDFRAPGKYSSWRRQWFTGCVALTEVRLVALQFNNLAINVPFTDERIRKMNFKADEDSLFVAFDAGLFHNDWSGTIEYKFRSDHAAKILEKLQAQMAFTSRGTH